MDAKNQRLVNKAVEVTATHERLVTASNIACRGGAVPVLAAFISECVAQAWAFRVVAVNNLFEGSGPRLTEWRLEYYAAQLWERYEIAIDVKALETEKGGYYRENNS